MNIAVLTFDRPESACVRYRVLTPLSRQGVNVSWAVRSQGDDHAVDGAALQAADVILVQRFFPLEFTEPLLESCFAGGRPVIYETDDLLTEVPAANPQHPLARRTLDTLGKLGGRFSAFTTSTPTLAKALAPYNRNVLVAPNRLDPELWRIKPPAESDGPVRLLYAGTPTHGEDLGMLEPVLIALLEQYGDGVELILFGCSTPKLERREGVRVLPPVDSYAEYAGAMGSLSFDIGLAPLADTPFNRAKSHVKWLEYTACGAVGVFSALPPYDCVRHGETGLLARTPDEWFDCLAALVEDPGARAAMAANAGSEVRERHLGGGKARELLNLCYGLAGKRPAS